ncbi:hypothetical protein Cgig2_031742 [Carnegiea gigantea]|uniref:Dynein light chain n=1 Tax=Carnegiea gigantea TaxID=171969 RepID=A0A9Q1QM28_9CARY|nr:hypothetical protein Cgig2_031742 [Carnegiea gigantea]
MAGVEEELERRSKFLNSLIQKKKAVEQQQQEEVLNVRVRASDMPLALQKRAFQCARNHLDSMPNKRLDSKRLALALKKSFQHGNVARFGSDDLNRGMEGGLAIPEFDSAYGPAWHCIVGTSFGSYVTHSIGGFLYFSIDKVYVLLFKTAVEPLQR